jgi:hypothetical protein
VIFIESKKKRLPRTTNTEQKKSPFVWKPSTISTIQSTSFFLCSYQKINFIKNFLARRSSKSNHSPLISPEENLPIDNHCPTRTLSNSTQQKPTITSNSIRNIYFFNDKSIFIILDVKTSTEVPSSEVLIFRPSK